MTVAGAVIGVGILGLVVTVCIVRKIPSKRAKSVLEADDDVKAVRVVKDEV